MSTVAEKKKGVGNITVAHLPEVEENRAFAEWPFKIGLVRLDALLIDDTYQRPVHEAFVAWGIDNFDPTLVGCIDVSQRKSNKLAILDGQQRYRIMEGVNKTACYCSIYDGMTIADEAGFFYRKNKDRRQMKRFYGFRAQVVAGDPTAIAIRNIVEGEGFFLADASNQSEAIGAIAAVETAFGYESEVRDDCLAPTLKTIRESFFGRKGSLDAWVIVGLGRFWQHYSDNEVDLTILRDALAEVGPLHYVGMARDAYHPTVGRGGQIASMPFIVARKTVELYNKAQNPGGKGKWSGRLDTKRLI